MRNSISQKHIENIKNIENSNSNKKEPKNEINFLVKQFDRVLLF